MPEGDAELIFSYLGYETRHSSFPLNKDTVLNIRLDSNNELAEVIVLSDKKEAGIQATAMGAYEIPMAQIQHTPAVLGEAVDAAAEALQSAVQNLVSIAELRDYCAEHAEYTEDAYTEESYAAYAEAFEAAQAVLEKTDASQDEVDAALAALTEAVNGLEEKPDATISKRQSGTGEPL